MSSLVSKLPFATIDPDPAFLLERKQGLEKYLQVYQYWRYIYVDNCIHVAMKCDLLNFVT